MPTATPTILLSFLIALLFQLFTPHFFPIIEANFFIPPLIFALYTFSFTTSAWLALFSGTLLDVLWLGPRIGFMGAAFLITTFLLYSSRLYFFKDAISTPLIMTFLFSLFLQLVVCLISPLFHRPLEWHLQSFLFIPLQNTAATLLLFLLPGFALRNYNRKYAA